MYRPSWENLTSEMEEMISEKNDLEDGSSSCSKTTVACQYTSQTITLGSDRAGWTWDSDEPTFCMLVAQRTLTHISELDCSLGARIHKPVATCRMEFGSRNDLGQLLHVSGLDVNDVETLVLDVQIPEVYAKIVTAYESLAVAVDGDAVDVISMGICIGPARDGSHDSIVVRQPGQLEVAREPEL